MNRGFVRNAVVLGLLTAVGPFAIDMYLPALPTIGRDLRADDGAVQLSLIAFFLSFAVSQILFGPLSDMLGRKRPLYIGLALFLVGSVGAALAPDILTLNLFRFVQGLGGAAAMVIPRAIVRDLHTGAEAARLTSLIMLVFSISPILAPLSGSILIALSGWRAVFWAVALAGVAGVVLVLTLLPETRPAEQRLGSTFGAVVTGYGRLLRDRNFIGLSLIGGFGIASFFVYLANSSFILIGHYGLTPTEYSLMFSLNAVSFFAMSQFTGQFVGRFGLPRVVRTATALFAASVVALLGVWLVGLGSLPVLAAFLFVGYGFLGLVIPTTAVLALEEHGPIAGMASALMGTLQMVSGAVMVGLLGLFSDGTALPMVAAIALCGVLTITLTALTLGRRSVPRPVDVPAA